VAELGRLLVYMLGHKPAEFGLVPTSEGFVPIKELLKAIHEEPGWRHIRQSHINEVLLGKDRFLFEVDGNRIRAREKKWQQSFEYLDRPAVPKILFTAVRRKAHPAVMEKGLKSVAGRYLVLSSDEEMSSKIGKRRDPQPVILRVEAEKAGKEGIFIYPFDTLFLCEEIPPRYIHGPPVAKEPLAAPVETTYKPETPGTFPLDLARDPDPYRRAQGRKEKGWKEAVRKTRRKRRG
jgi:putative RNA 2'-phosphotransferase